MKTKSPLRLAIIDDEESCLNDLLWELSNIAEPHNIVCKLTDPSIAIEVLKNVKIDLLFIDIEMPVINGFNLLRLLPRIDFEVVFVTAYDQYAIDAFKVNAMDYILKPVSGSELVRIFNKYLNKPIHTPKTLVNTKITKFLQENEEKLPIFDKAGYVFVPFKDIIRLEASSNYTMIYTIDNKYFVSKTLNEYRQCLPDTLFLCPHRSHLVNKSFISTLSYEQTTHLTMTDGSTVMVSRDKVKEIKRMLALL